MVCVVCHFPLTCEDTVTQPRPTPPGPAMPRRGYPYGRCSDPRKAREGHSHQRQDDWAQLVCVQQGWTYDDTYALKDKGKSGVHEKNLTPSAKLTQALGLIRRKMIAPGSVLIIEQLDRLSRAEVKKAHKVFQEILEAGVWICTREPFRIYKGDDSDNFFELMEPLWLMYLAHQESKKKSMRIGERWKADRKEARKHKAPISPAPPFWLTKAGGNYD